MLPLDTATIGAIIGLFVACIGCYVAADHEARRYAALYRARFERARIAGIWAARWRRSIAREMAHYAALEMAAFRRGDNVLASTPCNGLPIGAIRAACDRRSFQVLSSFHID